jgi:hypothetical protein
MGAPGQLPTAPNPAAAKTLADLWVYGTADQPGLVDAIQGNKGADSVAKTMTKAFIGLYTQVIQADPRLAGQLQQYINELTTFLQTL